MARTVRNPEARTRVVEAALRVVAAQGVHGATMRTIAAEAGVTTGFVTHYFDDKQQLLAAVVEHNNTRAGARVAQAVGTQRGLVALEGAVEALLPIDEERRLTWRIWVAAWQPAAGAEHLVDELRRGRGSVERLLARLLRQAVEDGELPASLDVPFEAERLMTMVAGTGLTAGVETPAHVRRTAKRMLAEHLAGLERQREQTRR